MTCIVVSVMMVGVCQAQLIKITTDQAFWYPFTFVENGQPRGIHIDLVKKALTNLDHEIKFFPKPWKRCLQDAKDGKYDAVVSASYKVERAKYLIYPTDAAVAKKSQWRITQVEYIVITNAGLDYRFNGDIKALPHPVRTPIGYSIADDLMSAGVKVFQAPDITDCVTQLVKSGRGSFVTPPQNAAHLQNLSQYKDKLLIHPRPLKSKSYYMVFSANRGQISPKTRQQIWNEIERLRDNAAYMTMLFNNYSGKK